MPKRSSSSARRPKQVGVWTAEPMTAEGPRKGESSTRIMRNGFPTQPARLVRGSSRRIMTLRFQPAHISVINRRASAEAVVGPAVPNKTRSKLTSRMSSRQSRPSKPHTKCQNGARRQGSATPRQTQARPCLLRAVPARPVCDGRLRREHSAVLWRQLQTGKKKHRQHFGRLDRSLHINFRPVLWRRR